MFLTLYFIFAIAVFLVELDDFDNMAVTPKEIYESNDMNMFGCVIVFMFCFILNPLFYIAHFIYWIFHVGRKD